MIPLRPYGKTGAMVSRLGFGAMRLAVTAPDGSTCFDESTPILRRAAELGVNIFDSHHNYLDGESETALGEALAGAPRESYYIQTKNPDYREETQGDTYEDRLHLALGKLKTDYIDFYLAHSLDWERFQKTGKRFLEVAEKAKRDGLIHHIGFSSHDEVPGVIKLIETGRFECALVQYNYLDTRYGEALAAAHEAGMGTSVMGPLGGGRFVAPSAFTNVSGENAGAVEAALRFAFANDDIDVVFSGMQAVDQVEHNVRIASDATPLTQKEQARIQQEIERRTKLAEVYCTGCRYCTPCPSEVEIAQIFELRNYAEVYGLHDYARRRYAQLAESSKAAPDCSDCGECEEKCPQKLPIREQLKHTHELLFGDSPETEA